MYIKLKCVSFILKHVSPDTSAGTEGRLYREQARKYDLLHGKNKILTRYFSAQFLPAPGLTLSLLVKWG
jgi:hypothetical protein